MTPVYEYKCECGKKFEKLVFSHEKKEIRCPDCKSLNVKKQFSLIAAPFNRRALSHDIPVDKSPRKRGARDIGGI